MCGIFGYVGDREATPLLFQGLRQLEYRGYDSAGLVTQRGLQLHLRKSVGRIANLESCLEARPAPGQLGISHTRWATHGQATEVNAHPHLSTDGRIAIVHNGVIENHSALRADLEKEGIVFRSSTDSEVIAQLVARHYQGDLLAAVRHVLPLLKGTYALGVLGTHNPGLLVGARRGSPLVLGIGQGEHFLASDPGALNGLTEQVVYLEDGQLCELTAEGRTIWDRECGRVTATVQTVQCEAGDGEIGAFPHYMLKEIYEQPDALARTLGDRIDTAAARVDLGSLLQDLPRWSQIERLILTSCGTSYHAGLVGKYLIEEFAHLPVEVEYASEFRYRRRPVDRNALVIAITQSGETADTLAAMREAKRRGYPTLAVCNVAGSSIDREAHGTIHLHAGPEIGVASTKAFTCQVTALAMLALHLGRRSHLNQADGAAMLHELQGLPELLRQTLRCHDAVREIATRYANYENFLYLGRQYLYPVALEGALKLKEISYIHAEGYPAAEMKHGPIALIDAQTPSVILMPRNAVYDKVMSNLEEVKARRGPVIAVVTEGDTEAAARADDVIAIPETPYYFQPLVTAVPLQLFAYHMALLRGCDVDRPRNLAKSVTVE